MSKSQAVKREQDTKDGMRDDCYIQEDESLLLMNTHKHVETPSDNEDGKFEDQGIDVIAEKLLNNRKNGNPKHKE